jgi:hypothetical protein
MAVATDEVLRMQEVREILGDLADSLGDVPDVLRRMLANEAKLDVDLWVRRLRNVLKVEPLEGELPQSDLFD